MNYLDIIILVPIIWGGFVGFKKGLIIEVISLIALGLGIWGGINFSDYLADIISDKLDSQYVPIVSFILTFIIIVVVVYMLGRMLEKVINLVQLKIINKLAGIVFGISKVALIISVLFLIFNKFDKNINIISPEIKDSSLLYKPISDMSLMLIPTLENSKLFDKDSINFPQDSLLLDKII